MLNIEDLRLQADTWAKNNLSCQVELISSSVQGGTEVATLRMVDDDGEETAQVDIKDAGTYMNRQMMFLIDSEGEMVCEAFGETVARFLYI